MFTISRYLRIPSLVLLSVLIGIFTFGMVFSFSARETLHNPENLKEWLRTDEVRKEIATAALSNVVASDQVDTAVSTIDQYFESDEEVDRASAEFVDELYEWFEGNNPETPVPTEIKIGPKISDRIDGVLDILGIEGVDDIVLNIELIGEGSGSLISFNNFYQRLYKLPEYFAIAIAVSSVVVLIWTMNIRRALFWISIGAFIGVALLYFVQEIVSEAPQTLRILLPFGFNGVGEFNFIRDTSVGQILFKEFLFDVRQNYRDEMLLITIFATVTLLFSQLTVKEKKS